jgi:hypothetical protein
MRTPARISGCRRISLWGTTSNSKRRSCSVWRTIGPASRRHLSIGRTFVAAWLRIAAGNRRTAGNQSSPAATAGTGRSASALRVPRREKPGRGPAVPGADRADVERSRADAHQRQPEAVPFARLGWGTQLARPGIPELPDSLRPVPDGIEVLAIVHGARLLSRLLKGRVP